MPDLPPDPPQIPYLCNHCGRTEFRLWVSPTAGGADASARVAGWRIGASQAKPRNVVCPACAGTDEAYWDRQTVGMALRAGVDAGRTPK